MPRPRSDTRDETLSRTRQQLLVAASVEFAREGYVGANINRISQTAGFAKGTIYNHFPSKQALILALIDETATAHTEYILAQVQPEDNPIQRLTRFFHTGLTYAQDNPTTALVIIQAIYGPDKEFKQRAFAAYDQLQHFVGQEIVERGITRGDFRAVDPQVMVALILSVYWGCCSMLDDDGKFRIAPDQAVDFVLDGLR